MITFLYAIYDNKATVYGTPFFQMNDLTALRTFGDLVNDTQSNVNKHPEDYSICKLAEYDDNEGKIKPLIVQTLARATDYLKDKQSDLTQMPIDFKTNNLVKEGVKT